MHDTDGIAEQTTNASIFIKSLLSQCELTEPSGAPLFTFQLNANNYSKLKSLLSRRPPSSASFKNAFWCAAFCLFGAEWYRREYQSGWTWLGIFESLGFELDPNQRADVVIKGLTYWKRPLNRYESNRNDYLGSVFSEGGLPFSLLAAEGGRFQNLFKRLLVEFDRARSFGLSPIPLIQKQLESMPDAFHAESTVTLLHDMVRNLYALIDTYSLDEKSEPSEYLDSVVKNWRVSFPIPLDIETGSKFLSGLLISAADRRKIKKREFSRLQLFQWLGNTAELSFSAIIEVSKQFPIPLTRNDLAAPIVEVLIYEGNKQVADLGMARAEISEHGTILHMRRTEVSFQRSYSELPLSLVVMQAGRLAYIEEIPNSSLSVHDMPIVLKNQNEKLVVIGGGSVSHKEPSLAVLIPQEAVVDTSTANLIENKAWDGYRRLVFSGKLTVCYPSTGAGDSDRYVLSSREGSYNKESLEINGEYFEFSSKEGYPIFKGIPEVLCHHPNADVFIGSTKIDCAANSGDLFGRQVLRVESEGKTLYRRKIAILPKDFEIQLRAGTTPKEGTLNIFSERPFIYEVSTDVETKVHSAEGTKIIELLSKGIPPIQINLLVQANLLAEPISLNIPFPSRGALAFDSNGKSLPTHCSIDELLGARLLLFRAPNKAKTEFEIELKAPTSARDNPSYYFHYDVYKSVEEVFLFELREKIKQLLATAQNHELDEVVRIIISCHGAGFKQYTVGWNRVSGNLHDESIEFNSQDIGDFSELNVELINIADLDQKPEILNQRMSNGVPIGTYELPCHRERPKLVVPQKDSKVSFRAIFVPPTEVAGLTSDIRTIEKAVQQFHPVTNTNAFIPVFDAMALEPEHSGWRYLDKLLEKFGHLPMATFEVWKSLSKQPDCLAMLPFASKLNVEQVLEVLQAQFNVVWELLPSQCWSDAREGYKTYLEKLGLPKPLITKYLQDKIDAITAFTSLPELFSVSAQNSAMYSFAVRNWRDDLLRYNADERIRWPQHYGLELERAALNYFNELVVFDVPNKFQCAVMYFPIVAAAVVSGNHSWEDILGVENVNYFLLRQLMDFDRDWFNPMFQYALSTFQE